MADNYEDEPLDGPEPERVGARLKAAREAQGLTIAQVAAETRIPQRHLQTIEAGEFGTLPSRTYAVGFSRNYAKAVGIDETEVVEAVRAELDAQDARPRHRPASFEPGDPARVPSRALGWLSILAVILVLGGLFFAARTFFAPAAELPSLIAEEEAEQAAAARPSTATQGQRAAAARSGPVVFTAEAEAWVRFYTPEGTLMEALMAPGDSYTVPAGARQPMLRTGRPDALRITVGGRPVPKLAEEQTVVSDVPVTAAALLAPRATPRPSPTT